VVRDFGADLSGLWVVGAGYLPALANQFAEAKALVDRADGGTLAFYEDATGGFTPVAEPWGQLIQEVRGLLAETIASVEATGEAIRQVAEIYAGSDTFARERVTSLSGRYTTTDPLVKVADLPGVPDGGN
jgi:hypothetical protein